MEHIYICINWISEFFIIILLSFYFNAMFFFFLFLQDLNIFFILHQHILCFTSAPLADDGFLQHQQHFILVVVVVAAAAVAVLMFDCIQRFVACANALAGPRAIDRCRCSVKMFIGWKGACSSLNHLLLFLFHSFHFVFFFCFTSRSSTHSFPLFYFSF